MKFLDMVKRAGEIYFCQRMRVGVLHWYFWHAPQLRKFYNKHKGQDCFIVGNGPSLNKMDLSALSDYYVFGLNKIFLLLDRVDLKISYHVAVNSYVIEQSKEEIESLLCPSFLSYFAARKIVRPSSNIYYIATGGKLKFQEDILNVIHEGWTVTYIALQLAYYMGFRRVYLIGVDHRFNAIGRPNETQYLDVEDQNHFDREYFKGGYWQLPDLEGSEIAYQLAKFYYTRDNRKIYDATIGGALQVFEKLDYHHALEMSKKIR